MIKQYKSDTTIWTRWSERD